MQSQPDDGRNGDAKARNRFIVIQLMRVGGVAMVMFGIAVLRGLVQLPDVVGYVLIVMGIGEAFVAPQMLARLWSSERR
jgi:type IV secretory pathway VirB2 component (pilin)